MLLTIILLPIIGALCVPLFKKAGVRPSVAALILGAAVFCCAVYLLVMAGRGVQMSYALAMPLGFGPHFYLDRLAAFMAVCSSFLSLIIIIYSTGYIHDKEYETEYYAMVVLFLGSMTGLIFSFNLIWTFVFWEMTAVCSWRLVGFYRSDFDRRKAVKTFLITVFGALFLLLGITAVYIATGTSDLTALRGVYIPAAAGVFLVLGMFSKSAILPFSSWLPDAGVAPSPVTALLHAAVLVKIGVYVFARVFYTVTLDPGLGFLVALFAAVSSLVAGGAALRETNIKRVIAYSTISQLGFIYFALATGTTMGFVAGMLFVMMHGVAKGGLFLCAGLIEHKTHTKDISKMGGLYRVMPVTAIVFGICALSVAGIPPAGGFFSKFLVFKAAVFSGFGFITLLFLIAACFTAAYLLRLFHMVFLGSPSQEWVTGPEGEKPSVVSVSILAFITLAAFIFVKFPIGYLVKASSQMGVL